MTNINPELIAKALQEFTKPRAHTNMSLDGTRAKLTAALAAIADDLRAEGAVQALEDARDAGATELLKLLMAEDDAQYIGGSSRGMGPIEACETVEGWLDARATKLREGAGADPLDHSAERCGWKRPMLHGPDVSCGLPRGHTGACSFDQPPSPDPLDPSMAECSRCGQAYSGTPEALLAHHGECTGETPKNPMGDPLNEGDHQARVDHARTLRSVIRAFEASTPYTDPSTSPQTTRKDH